MLAPKLLQFLSLYLESYILTEKKMLILYFLNSIEEISIHKAVQFCEVFTRVLYVPLAGQKYSTED